MSACTGCGYGCDEEGEGEPEDEMPEGVIEINGIKYAPVIEQDEEDEEESEEDEMEDEDLDLEAVIKELEAEVVRLKAVTD